MTAEPSTQPLVVISLALGVLPVRICSEDLAWVPRPRFYWVSCWLVCHFWQNFFFQNVVRDLVGLILSNTTLHKIFKAPVGS